MPQLKRTILLVHGLRGHIDKVSTGVAGYLQSLDVEGSIRASTPGWRAQPAALDHAPPPSQETIEHLIGRGYLIAPDVDETQQLHALVADLRSARQIPNFSFLISYDCNLACRYCYQRELRDSLKRTGPATIMDRPMAARILKAIPAIEAQYGYLPNADQPREITLYGGEPLRTEHRSVVQFILEGLAELGPMHVTALTNGYDLDAFEDLLGPHGISSIQVTLDGPAALHNLSRRSSLDRGTFAAIAQNVTLALEHHVDVSLRINVDRRNLDHLPQLAGEIMARDWHRRPLFRAYASPVTERNPLDSLGHLELTETILAQRKLHPAMCLVGTPGVRTFQDALSALRRGVDLNRRAVFCAAHGGNLVIDPFGEVYVCYEKTGESPARGGDIDPDGRFIPNRDIITHWKSLDVTRNTTCLECPYALFCGGGCVLTAYRFSGQWETPVCADFAACFHNELAAAYALSQAATRG